MLCEEVETYLQLEAAKVQRCSRRRGSVSVAAATSGGVSAVPAVSAILKCCLMLVEAGGDKILGWRTLIELYFTVTSTPLSSFFK